MMNTPKDPEALTQMLNQFPVPMFAAERTAPSEQFRFVSINTAMEMSGKRSARDVLGRTARDLLSEEEANIVERAYADCASRREVVRFREAFITDGRKTIWDTTLQPVTLDGGHDRVLGTSIALVDGVAVVPAFDDIQYFSSMAEYQLQNLITMFDGLREQELFLSENEQRVARLSGMCRTIQRAVGDIRSVVQQAQNRPRSNHGAAQPAPAPVPRVQSGTLEALFKH